MRYPIGIVAVAFSGATPRRCAERASALGFDHLDVDEAALGALAAGSPSPVPIGDVIARRGFPAGRTRVAPAPRADRSYDDLVRLLRAHPGCRLEPGPGTVAGSAAAVRSLVEDVPGLRFCIDTGHVAAWGEDPVDLLDLADHVQLRQAAPGDPQRHPGDGGDVDFGAVVRRLGEVGYRGRLSVEYFDLPELGWPLEDPVGCAVALRDHVRRIMAA